MDPRKKLADVLKRFPMSGLVLALFALYFLVSILLSVAMMSADGSMISVMKSRSKPPPTEEYACLG
jgi:hypothetical protein